MGHFLDVILELEAETLSESRFFNGRSDHMGFRSEFSRTIDLLAEEGSKIEVDRGRDSVWPISRRTEAC